MWVIATPGTLYLADDESCKLIDARTGEVTGRIVIPEGAAGCYSFFAYLPK